MLSSETFNAGGIYSYHSIFKLSSLTVTDGDYCKQSIETAGLEVYGGYYNSGTVLSTATGALAATLAVVLRHLVP
jgi:hypothetical protein